MNVIWWNGSADCIKNQVRCPSTLAIITVDRRCTFTSFGLGVGPFLLISVADDARSICCWSQFEFDISSRACSSSSRTYSTLNSPIVSYRIVSFHASFVGAAEFYKVQNRATFNVKTVNLFNHYLMLNTATFKSWEWAKKNCYTEKF